MIFLLITIDVKRYELLLDTYRSIRKDIDCDSSEEDKEFRKTNEKKN